jgi:hypothetical protein
MKQILISLLSLVMFQCGYRAPETAEVYDPENHSDHKIDLASKESIIELYQIMKDTHEVFNKCHVTYWAEGGTMLGAVRNQGIIPWDDDNDIMVPKSEIKKILALRATFSHLGYLIEEVFFGYRIVKTKRVDQKEAQPQVDIFVMKEKNSSFFYDRGDWGTRKVTDQATGETRIEPIHIHASEVFHTKEVPFGPIRVMIPNQPEPYLDHMFKGWGKVAFTYGHQGQRKFKIDLERHSHFKLPAPLDPSDFKSIDVKHEMKNRVPEHLDCPPMPSEKDKNPENPRPVFFDGV